MRAVMDDVERRVNDSFVQFWGGSRAEASAVKHLIIGEAPPFPRDGDVERMTYAYKIPDDAYPGGSFLKALLCAHGYEREAAKTITKGTAQKLAALPSVRLPSPQRSSDAGGSQIWSRCP